jgi:hypothetical protein
MLPLFALNNGLQKIIRVAAEQLCSLSCAAPQNVEKEQRLYGNV